MSLKVLGKEPEKKEYVYPLAYKSKSSGAVVLFTGLKTGVALSSSQSHYLGKHQSGWREHTDTNTWEPIDISIVHP